MQLWKVIQACLVFQVMMGPQESLGLRETRAAQVELALRGLMELQESLACLEEREQMANQVCQEVLGMMD